MSFDKHDLDKLKQKITDITETAIQLDNRQKRIIQTTQSINMTLKNGIEGENNEKLAYDISQDKMKNLRNQIDGSNKTIAQIRDKLKKVQDKIK